MIEQLLGFWFSVLSFIQSAVAFIVSNIAVLLALIAIFFTALKDFILPFFNRPILNFRYAERLPFRKENVIIGNQKIVGPPEINGINLVGTFLRMKVTNNGKGPAINCRCQILNIVKENEILTDYQGFPLKWASRPEAVLDQCNGERLSISIGESEFIDIAVAVNTDKKIHFEKYHSVAIGIPEELSPGKYNLNLLFSGDNFSPYEITLELQKQDDLNINGIQMKLLNVKQVRK